MTSDRLLNHKFNQWKLYSPDALLKWIRENTEVMVEPYGHVIVWKGDTL